MQNTKVHFARDRINGAIALDFKKAQLTGRGGSGGGTFARLLKRSNKVFFLLQSTKNLPLSKCSGDITGRRLFRLHNTSILDFKGHTWHVWFD